MAQEMDKEEKQRLKLQAQLERQSKRLQKLCKQPPGVEPITKYRNAWPRFLGGQRSRRLMERAERELALEDLGPIDHLAALVIAMAWHRHCAYILCVATHPGVTCDELTDDYGLAYSNHRMVFRRFNKVLAKVGWRFASYPKGAQNEPWGWTLEKIPKQPFLR